MEVWKPVVGYEHAYKVSNYGRLKSVRRLKCGRCRDLIIKCSVEKNKGYIKTSLTKNGSTKTIRVHRLVCEAFHGPCPDGMEVLHGDDVKTNNYASNLSWGTRADNIGKLTEPCIHIILAMLAAGHRVADIAARFDIGKRYVYKLKYGEKWAHLPRPYTLTHAKT